MEPRGAGIGFDRNALAVQSALDTDPRRAWTVEEVAQAAGLDALAAETALVKLAGTNGAERAGGRWKR